MSMFRVLSFFALALLVSLGPACDCSDGSEENPDTIPDMAEDMPDADICSTCRGDQVCVDMPNGDQACVCPAGTSHADGVCEADSVCTPTTCNGQGDCRDSIDGPRCDCELGWAGDFCGECDTVNGWTSDGRGGCTDDPCSTIQCPDRVCQVQDGAPICVCQAGSQADGMGGCQPDESCTPTTCNGHGSCDDSGAAVVCTCEAGWEAPNCQSCDTPAGYHPDGMGGCTNDPCLPNPCTMSNQSDCIAQGVSYMCGCDPGFHLESGTCEPDQTCGVDSCNGHGACDDAGGVLTCDCDPGHTGETCAACDLAAGYHADGMGGCTMDICLPNPCTQIPNKSVCVSGGTGFICECAAGYHADGAGGCTTDPCLPNLCAANNQSCRNNNGAPECYTPDCDDQNPCTTDELVNGVCVFSNLPNNTSCATNACTTGQVCMAGVCGGGSPRVCDDQNPCTDDSCDPNTGCSFTNNDANIPDDGIPCTLGSCSNGFASHVANNASCEDQLFCNGVEICQPQNPQADSSGCVKTNVPLAPPNPGPCAMYGACDEATDSFPLNTLGAGAPCNDGIWCTSNDVCDVSGACTGGLTANCGDPTTGTCSTLTDIEPVIGLATVTVTTQITVNGQALSTLNSNDGTYNTLYAVDVQTGTRHTLALWYWNNGNPVVSYGERLIAGVYDILYMRGTTSSSEKFVYRTTSADNLPNGVTYVQRNVLFAAGEKTLNVDISTATLTTNISVNNQPLSSFTTNDGTYNYLYAVDVLTGTRHTLALWYWNNGNPVVQYGERIVAGTYDILYMRGTTSSTETFTYRTTSADTLPNGVIYLEKNKVIGAGARTLDVDVPITQLTTVVTVGGQPLSANVSSDGTYNYLYAVDTTTGTRHTLALWYWNNGNPVIQYGDRLISGTYDFLFMRGTTSSSEKYVYRTTSADAVPNGVVYLERNRTVSGVSQTLNLDVPVAVLTTTVQVNGQELNTITSSDGTYNYIYAVSKGTGTRHTLALWYWNNGNPTIQYGERLVADTYDILYMRGTTSSSEKHVYRTTSSDALPNAVTYIQKDVVIGPGARSLTLSVPTTAITTQITTNGQPLTSISSVDGTYNSVYAVDVDTGTRHTLALWYWNNGNPVVQYGERIVAGSYHLLYMRGTTSSTEKHVYRTTALDALPNSVIFLQRNVMISGASQTLNVDIPHVGYLADVNVNGQPLSAITSSDGTYNSLYAVSRLTGTRHTLALWYWNNGNPTVSRGERFVAGEYDVLFMRGTTSSSEKFVYRTTSADALPNGVNYIGQCVRID